MFLTIAVLFSASPSYAFEQLTTKDADPENIAKINDQISSLQNPYFIEYDERKLLIGDNLTPYGLRKYSEQTYAGNWAQCGDTSVFLISYPQFKSNRSTTQLELLLRYKGKNINRFAVPTSEYQELSDYKLHLSPGCQQVLISSAKAIYKLDLSQPHSEFKKVFLPRLNSFYFYDDDKIVYEIYSQGKQQIYLSSLSNLEERQLLDEVTTSSSLSLDLVNRENICWTLREREASSTVLVKCRSNLDSKTQWQKLVTFHAEGKDFNFFKIISPEFIKITSSVGFRKKIIQINNSQVALETDLNFAFLSGHKIILEKKYGVGDSRLVLFDFIQKRELNTGMDLFPFGALIELRDGVNAVALNSYGQKTFISIDDKAVPSTFTFPDFKIPTEISTVKFKAQDGFQQFGYLVKRAGLQLPKATIVYVHGGGCHITLSPSQMYINAQILELASRGIDILFITYRNDIFEGNTGMPRTQKNCAVEEMLDIDSGRNYLKNKYPTAPVYLWGHSHGSYLVNVMVTQDSKVSGFAGVISQSGIWDYGFGYDFIKEAIDHYNPTRAPLKFIQNINVPFLMYHGTYDKNANYDMHAVPFLNLSGVQKIREDDEFTFYQHPTKPINAIITRAEEHHISRLSSHTHFINAVLKFIQN